MCVFNGRAFLDTQLDSIAAQSRLPDTMAVVDDRSTDGSFERLQAWAATVPFSVGVHRNAERLGVVRNFDRAVRLLSADVIFLCDQDDVWAPDRLERMAARFEADPDLLLLHTDARRIDGNGREMDGTLFHALAVRPQELRWLGQGQAVDAYLRRNLATGATMAFRTSLLRFVQPFPEDWVHDEWLALCAAMVGRVDVMQECLVAYRQHTGNQIGAHRPGLREILGLLFVSRGDFYRQRARKVEILRERLLASDLALRPGAMEKLEGKIRHQRFRAGLPANRLARVLPVLGEILSGRYRRYSRATQAIVQDLCESP